jgi:hypothetical protein
VDSSTRVRFSPVTPITGNEREGSVHASEHVNQVRLQRSGVRRNPQGLARLVVIVQTDTMEFDPPGRLVQLQRRVHWGTGSSGRAADSKPAISEFESLVPRQSLCRGRSNARSFNGRTRAFGTRYEGSIPSLAASFSGCPSTVGWPPYKGTDILDATSEFGYHQGDNIRQAADGRSRCPEDTRWRLTPLLDQLRPQIREVFRHHWAFGSARSQARVGIGLVGGKLLDRC